MASSGIIDAQFNRAVDIVQRSVQTLTEQQTIISADLLSLPKAGPVQTSYEEKLWLYSLYKQATEGDIAAPRPNLLDMLGRAKWDSWNRQKGTGQDDAKMKYVSALVKILRKTSSGDAPNHYIAELEAFQETPLSPSSSTSSFHSSHASPPPSPGLREQLFPPPDPSLPPPDVSPEYIPPSALNASHKSLLNLHQPVSSVSQQADYAESSRGPIAQGQSQSRTHSLVGGVRRSKDSVHSFRHRHHPPTPSALGFVPDAPIGHGGPGPRAYTPQIPAASPVQRDFISATPDLLSASPYIGLGGGTNYHRAGSTSTFAPAPLNLPYTLQQIQTSLTALHERMSILERTQAMILRRDERRRGWFWTSREEEELEEGEEQAERARWGNTATTTTRRRRTKGLTIRAMWFLLGLLRRAIVDTSIAIFLALAVSILLGGGWRQARGMLQAWAARARRLITHAA